MGKEGKTGAAGPIGPAGSAANADLGQLGYCVNVTYYTDDTGVGTSFTWVGGVGLTNPTITNGTQSCTTGTFTPIAATPASPTQ
jgi:hypothetical protein